MRVILLKPDPGVGRLKRWLRLGSALGASVASGMH